MLSSEHNESRLGIPVQWVRLCLEKGDSDCSCISIFAVSYTVAKPQYILPYAYPYHYGYYGAYYPHYFYGR